MLAGSLSEFSIPDIFSLLSATRKTGVLNLEGEQAAGAVWISQGQVVFAASNVHRSPLVARLLHGGEIGTGDAESVVSRQAEAPFGVSEVLTEAGIPSDRAALLIRDAIVDAVFDLSRWSGGSFAFDASVAAQSSSVAVPTEEIMAAVDERLADWPRIADLVPSPGHVPAAIARPDAASSEVTDARLQITLAQWEVLTLIDGRRSVADLVRLTGQGTYGVGTVLASLISGGLVEVQPDGSGESEVEAAARQLSQLEHRLLGASEPERRPSGVLDHAPPAAPPTAHGLAPTSAAPVEAAPVEAATDDLAPMDTPPVELAGPVAAAEPAVAPAASSEDEAAVPAQGAGAAEPSAEVPDAPSEEPEPAPASVPAEAPAPSDAPDPMDVLADLPGAPAAGEPTASSREDERRSRELAALGLGGDLPQQAATAVAEPKVKRDAAVDADLLARLIDGVKGG